MHASDYCFLLQVILAELDQSGFQCSFSDDEDLTTITEGGNIYAFQAPLSFKPASSSYLSGMFCCVGGNFLEYFQCSENKLLLLAITFGGQHFAPC